MPSYFFDIPDTGTTVQKAVTDNVTKNILANVGIPHADIVYEGEEYTEQSQTGSTIGEVRQQSFGSSERIVLSVDEVRDPTTRIERAPGYDLEVPFFLDREHGVKLAPSMVKYDVNVSIKRRASSKAVIQKWCNEIQRKIDMGGDMLVTQAEFYYRIPVPALNLLAECYNTKYFDVEPPYSLTDYFKRWFTNNVTLTSNLSGVSQDYSVRHTELRIMGIFDTEGPVAVKGQGFTAWECNFNFKFNYHRPETVEAVFPIMLNNTLVSKEWWLSNLAPGMVDYTDGVAGTFVEAAMHITKPAYLRLPLYIPECDKPNLPFPYSMIEHVELAVIHLEMEANEEAPNLLFNLGELGDEISLSELIKDYIVNSYCGEYTGENSIIQVYLYENNGIVDADRIIIDSDLNVWFNGPIDRSKIYRVKIVILLDWSELTDAGFNWLRQYPDLVQTILEEFRPLVLEQVDIDLTRDNFRVGTLHQIIELLNAYDTNNNRSSMRRMITVHNNTIVAYRRNL